MEIKIRDLNSEVLSALDNQARAQGKSRNEYLKEQLTLLARFPELRQQEDKYIAIVDKLTAVVQENTDVIRLFIGGPNENYDE